MTIKEEKQMIKQADSIFQAVIDDLEHWQPQKEGAERTKKDIIAHLKEQMKG